MRNRPDRFRPAGFRFQGCLVQARHDLGIAVTGAAGPPPVTSDPTVTGVAEYASIQGSGSPAVTIQFEYNADTVPDASTSVLPSASPNGSFSYSLPNLAYGVVTIHARAEHLSMQGGFEQFGAWTSLTFDFEPPPAPTITGLALKNATGAPANPTQTTDPTLTGTIVGAAVGQAVNVEFDTNDDGIADAQIAATGNTFTFTPTGLDPGPITIQARSVVHQPNSTELSYSVWTSLTFTYVATPSAPPAIQGLQLASLAGTTTTATSDPVTADPTLTGVAEYASIQGPGTGVQGDGASSATGVDFQTVQFNYDGDGTPDASTTTDAQGKFTFTPTGLAAGPVTIGVRAKVWDMASNADLYSSWSTISFTYQPAAANSVVVSQFALLDNTGTAAAPQATDPTVTGVAEYASIQGSGGQASGGGNAPVDSTASSATAYATIQFDTNGDGTPDASVVADANGAFQFTPIGLPFGNVTIAARAVTHDTAAGGFTYGAWTPLTFDYLQTVVPAPAIDSFTLASVTDSPTSGGTPVTANATVKGHVNYQGDPTQLVIEITDPNEASALGAGIDAAGYTTVIPDAQGNFIFTPQYLSLGAATIEARIQSYFDPATQAIVTGAWTSLSFTFETQPRSAPAIVSLGLVDSTGAVTTATTSGDLQPAIGGTVSYQGDLAGITVEYSLDGGETTAGTSSSGPLTTDAYGNFNFSPAGLAAGSVTIDARTQVFDDVGNQLLTGAWTPFTFTYQPPAAPSLAVGAFALANSTTDSQGNVTASDPTVTGVAEFVRIPTDGTSIQGAGASSATPVGNVVVQFDTNGDGTPDGTTTTDASGNFTYTPAGLTAGAVTIAARVVDTAADGTSVFSPWTSLSFTYVPAGTGAPVISQLVLADDNGASSTDLSTSDPTVAGLATIQGSASPAAPAVGVVIEFDTNGDGVADGSVTTNSHGQFTYTPYVAYGVNTIGASIAGTAPDGSSTLGPWITLSFEYAADPDSAAAQAAAAALAANGTSAAQTAHDAAVAAASAQSQSAQDTASGNYRSATNGAVATGDAATAAATAAYSSQTATANTAYDAAVASAGQAFTTAMHSFTADPTSYSMPKFTWPAAPADPAGPTDAEPSPPIQAPSYSGPAFDVTADPGYQAGVASAQATYDGSIEGATTTYDSAVQQAKTNYDAAVQSAQQTRYQTLETAQNAYEAALTAPNPTSIVAATTAYTTALSQIRSTSDAQGAATAAQYEATLAAAQAQYEATASATHNPAALSAAAAQLAQATDAADHAWGDANADSGLTANLSLDAASATYRQVRATADEWTAVNFAQASGALDAASADANQAYQQALADATRGQADAVAQAAHDRSYSNIDAETALTQAVADAAATTTAAWASAEGTPWGQYQSDLAANEAQYVNDDAAANATLRKAEADADADYEKTKAIDEANDEDETTQAGALAQAAVDGSNTLVTLAVDDAQAQMTGNQDAAAEYGQQQDGSAHVEHDTMIAMDAIAQTYQDAIAAANAANDPVAYDAAEVASGNAAGPISAASDASRAQLVHDYSAALANTQLTAADTESANNLTAEQALAQDEHDRNVGTATALADFDKANATADRDQIVAVAQADQAFGDAEAAFQGTLDLANALSENTFKDTVATAYVSQMQAWAAGVGTPWATLQAALAADDAQWTMAMAQAKVDQAQAMQAPNLAWAVANDAAEETQTVDDANAQATSVVANGDATITQATSVADAQLTQQNDDAVAALTFQQAVAGETTTEALYENDENLALLRPGMEAAPLAWAVAVAGDPALVASGPQPEVAYVQAIGANAQTFADAQANADAQFATDQAASVQALAITQAGDQQTSDVTAAQADNTLADAQAQADQSQTHAEAFAQAQLDLSTSNDSQQYSVAQATDDAAALAATAASAGTPLATYQAAVAAADATQATANATAAEAYETLATGADVQLSDDQAAADYVQTTSTSAQILLLATDAAGFQKTQAVDDAALTYDEATAAADAGGVWLNAVAGAYADFFDQNIQATAAYLDAAGAASTKIVQTVAASWYFSDFQSALSAVQTAQAKGLETAYLTSVTTQGNSGMAESEALGNADLNLAGDVGQAKVHLATGLADDANTEAVDEQAAAYHEAQTLDTADVTHSTAAAQAQVNWTTTTTNAATAETAANGLASVASATSVANAQADFQASVAAAAATTANAWALSDGSAQARFEAAAANAWSAWITATSPAFVADQSATAQAAATYANSTAAINATQEQQSSTEDLTLATTVAQAAVTERDQQAAADQTYAIATTADQGAHDVANAVADQTAVVAEAEANLQFNLAQTQAQALEAQVFVTADTGYDSTPITNWYTLTLAQATATEGDSRQNATLAWTKSKAQNDATLEIDQAAATQTHDTDVADAAHTYAYAAANAQWTHDENVAAEAQTASVAADVAALTQAQTSNAADGTFAIAQYANAATVTQTLAATIRTPWVNYQAALATAEAAWAVANAPNEVNYQNTLAADQQTASDALAAAALTNADALATNNLQLATATADADQTQTVADAAAAYAQQQADASATQAYLVASAQASHDYNVALDSFALESVEGVSSDSIHDQFLAAKAALVAADAEDPQNYLAGEADANAAFTDATEADQQAHFASVEQAQLAATVAGDAASEAYQASVAQANFTQTQSDVLADQSFQTAGSASYASAMQTFDQSSPSPWADQHAAQAAAKATLTAAMAHDSALEQIALSGADEAQSIANALAGQALADAQAQAATDLAIAQAGADSTLDTALAAAAAALAPFAPNAVDSLPQPTSPSTPVGAPLATFVPSVNLDAPNWEVATMSWGQVAAAFNPIYGEGLDTGGYSWWWQSYSSVDDVSLYFSFLATWRPDASLAAGLRPWTSTAAVPTPWWPKETQGLIQNMFGSWPGPQVGFMGGGPDMFDLGMPGNVFMPGTAPWSEQSDLSGGVPTYAMVVGIDIGGLYAGIYSAYEYGLLLNALYAGDYMETANGEFVPGPAPMLSPPTPDVTTLQLMADKPALAQLSDASQPSKDDAGGATEVVQVAEQTVEDGVHTAASQAAQNQVQTQLASVNFNDVPTERIDAMIADKLAFRPSQNNYFVYVADVVGANVEMLLLTKVIDSKTIVDSSGQAVDVTTGSHYKVVSMRSVPIGGGAAPIGDILAQFQSQQGADNEYTFYSAGRSRSANTALLGTIEFVVHATPFLGTADYIAQGEYLEGALSAAGDAAMLLTGGVAKVATTARAARNIRIGAIGLEAGVGAVRAGQGVFALQEGETSAAAGYFGEAMLRFIGVSTSAIKELKAAQAARAAEMEAVLGPKPGKALGDAPVDGPDAPRNQGGINQSNMVPSGFRIGGPVSPADIRVDYLKGAKGANPAIDQIATVLQNATAEQATRLRAMADLAANRGSQTLEQVIPGFAYLPTRTQRYLQGNANNLGRFGWALHDMVEESLKQSSTLRRFDLKAQDFAYGGGIPDYQIELPNGSRAVFDLTGAGSAGKIMRKYNQEDVDFLVEIIHPGPGP